MKSPEAITAFDEKNFRRICDLLAKKDKELNTVLKVHGYPPMWTRKNTFETIVHIILEQQVSLASALAALNKLKEHVGKITPKAVLELSDKDMRDCFVSRQKMVYIRGLATAISGGEINLKKLEVLSNDEVRNILIQLKGIGHWTIDVYLMSVLQRADIFPIGDLAAVNATKKLKQLEFTTSKEHIIKLADKWKPYRSVACMMLWHYYLSDRKFHSG